MKKTATKEIHACDVCGAEIGYPRPCMECGKDICYECSKTHAKEYPHGVNVSGSGDGFYCAECDAKLTASGTDELHTAYRAVERLRMEAKAMWEDFDRRRKAAEAKVQALHG